MHATSQKILKYSEEILLIVAGLSAIGIGYTAYAASLWDGEVLSSYSKANAQLTDANTTYLDSTVRGDTLTDTEFNQLSSDHKEQTSQVDMLNQSAEVADKTSDKFLLYSMFYSIILFFTSLAPIAKRNSSRIALIVLVSCVFAAISIFVGMLRLP